VHTGCRMKCCCVGRDMTLCFASPCRLIPLHQSAVLLLNS
jgi:hypothetical protein